MRMEQHPIPRQITSFEFKLIGFMTLHQFIYMVVFALLGVLFWFIPLPLPLGFFTKLLAVVIGVAGIVFAMVPINDRPMDVFVKNLYKRLTSPTQYMYHKNNKSFEILNNLYFLADPHRVVAHVDAQEKLSRYMAKAHPRPTQEVAKSARLQGVNQALSARATPLTAATMKTVKSRGSAAGFAPIRTLATKQTKKPFFFGIAHNKKKTPLPNMLVYVKNSQDKPIRLLKTNPHGVFATFTKLPPGQYVLEAQDPNKKYFFDTIKVVLQDTNPHQIEITSKEMI